MSRSSHTVAVTVVAALVLAMLLPGCSSYGEVNQKTYEFAKALVSTCNRKDEPGLAKVAEMITAAETAGEISSSESGWLMDIVAQAQAGRWEDAQQMARQMMRDQSSG